MKKFALVCIAGSAIALSACHSTGMGNVDTAPPYETERTATHSNNTDTTVVTPVKTAPKAERVFRTMQSK